MNNSKHEIGCIIATYEITTCKIGKREHALQIPIQIDIPKDNNHQSFCYVSYCMWNGS